MSEIEKSNDTQGLKVKAICPNCSGNTNHKVQFSIDKSVNESFDGIPISWQGSYQIIKCDGCGGIAFRQTNWHSEHIDHPTEIIYPRPENDEKIINDDKNKKQMKTSDSIRLNKLSIKNYKRLDSLEIEFPQPVMKNDADILVFGSKNGGGKTSILECCSLLILAAIIGERVNRFGDSELLFDIASLLIKAGQQESIISGEFEYGSKKCTVSLTIDKKQGFVIHQTKGDKLFDSFRDDKKKYLSEIDYFLNSVLSFSSEPLIIPPLLHFNSYRKVQELNPELGMMSDDYSTPRNMRFPSMRRNLGAPVISSFKLEIVRSLMGKAALFEGIYQQESELVLTKLNTLIEQYCGGQIENLRPLPNNKVDIRIKPIGGQESFSFDGLSSGQKEIIATLFLIWKNTQTHSGIILIDEPELHLNTEWQGDFVRQLHKLAPHNQYILATHSEEIFRSVDESYRAILTTDDEVGENQ